MADLRTERQLLEDISVKLDKLIGFAAISGRDQTSQIEVLRGLGFEWGDIGIMVGLKADAARKRLESRAKGRGTKANGTTAK